MNPKTAKQANPYHVFQAAEAFNNACHIYHANGTHEPYRSRSIVLVTNAALALELYLKCLLMIEKGAYPETHDTEELFRLLGKRLKQSIERKRKKLVSDLSWYNELEKQELKSLADVLYLGKDAFVHFRYAFEQQAENRIFASGLVIAVVRDFLLFVHPEWADRSQ